MEYLSISQMSDIWILSRRRIQVLFANDRIEGAVRIGFAWAIPANAQKPSDTRIKSGKYIKQPKEECNDKKS